jgi:TolB-like protein
MNQSCLNRLLRSSVFLFCLLALALPAFAQKVVAVSDFTTADFALEPKMRGVADVLRSELAKSNLIRIVDRSNFEQVFNELAQQRMGFTDPSSVKRIGAMLNADYLVVGSITREGNTESLDVFGAGITASVAIQMIDVQSGRVVGAETLRPSSWNDYVTRAPAAARSLINRIPQQAQNTFGGKWEASIEHDGLEDIYELIFNTNGACTATIFSYDADNNETTQTAEGTYSLANDVLSVNVNFRRGGTLRHLTKIEWKVAFSLSNDRNSFNVVIPSSSLANAKRVRATFIKK